MQTMTAGSGRGARASHTTKSGKENTMTTQVEPILWEASLPQAKARAAQEDKPILLDFSAAPT